MPDLKTEQITKRKGMDEALFAAVRMGDVVNQLGINDLLVQVAVDDLVSAEDTPTVCGGEPSFGVGLNAEVVFGQSVQPRIEEVENELSVVGEMTAKRRKTCHLVLDGQ